MCSLISRNGIKFLCAVKVRGVYASCQVTVLRNEVRHHYRARFKVMVMTYDSVNVHFIKFCILYRFWHLIDGMALLNIRSHDITDAWGYVYKCVFSLSGSFFIKNRNVIFQPKQFSHNLDLYKTQ